MPLPCFNQIKKKKKKRKKASKKKQSTSYKITKLILISIIIMKYL